MCPQRQAAGPRWTQRVVYLLTILSRPRAHFRCHRLHGKHWHLVSRLRPGWAAARTAHIPRWQWGRPTSRDYKGEFLYLECASCYQSRGFVCQYFNLVCDCGCIHLLFMYLWHHKTHLTPHVCMCVCRILLIFLLHLFSGSWNPDKGANPRDEPKLHRIQVPSDQSPSMDQG